MADRYCHVMSRLSRGGKRVFYYRCPKTGRTTRLPTAPGDPQFDAAYLQLRKG